MMVAVGYSEEARAAAQPVVMPRGGPGQNDVGIPVVSRVVAGARRGRLSRLDAGGAGGAACRCIAGRELLPNLSTVQAESRPVVAALDEGRAFGHELGALAERFREHVFSPPS